VPELEPARVGLGGLTFGLLKAVTLSVTGSLGVSVETE